MAEVRVGQAEFLGAEQNRGWGSLERAFYETCAIFQAADRVPQFAMPGRGGADDQAALGNGIACYELAVYYRRQGQPVPAAQYEARAKELGYTPPATLDNVRK